MRWNPFSISWRRKAARMEKPLNSKLLSGEEWGRVPEHICATEPASTALCPPCVHVVGTDGSYSKTPRATEAISKRPVEPSRERERVGDEDKGILESLSFQYFHGYHPKTQEALLDLKLSETSRSNAASWSVGNWIHLLVILNNFGYPGVQWSYSILQELFNARSYSICIALYMSSVLNPINREAVRKCDNIPSTSIPHHKLIFHQMSAVDTIVSTVLTGAVWKEHEEEIMMLLTELVKHLTELFVHSQVTRRWRPQQ